MAPPRAKPDERLTRKPLSRFSVPCYYVDGASPRARYGLLRPFRGPVAAALPTEVGRAGHLLTIEGPFHGDFEELGTGVEILVSSLFKEVAQASGQFRFGEPRTLALKGLSGEQTVFPVEVAASRP